MRLFRLHAKRFPKLPPRLRERNQRATPPTLQPPLPTSKVQRTRLRPQLTMPKRLRRRQNALRPQNLRTTTTRLRTGVNLKALRTIALTLSYLFQKGTPGLRRLWPTRSQQRTLPPRLLRTLRLPVRLFRLHAKQLRKLPTRLRGRNQRGRMPKLQPRLPTPNGKSYSTVQRTWLKPQLTLPKRLRQRRNALRPPNRLRSTTTRLRSTTSTGPNGPSTPSRPDLWSAASISKT